MNDLQRLHCFQKPQPTHYISIRRQEVVYLRQVNTHPELSTNLQERMESPRNPGDIGDSADMRGIGTC